MEGGLSDDFMCEYKVENAVKMNFITENPLDVEIFRNCFKSLSLTQEYNTQFIYTLRSTNTHTSQCLDCVYLSKRNADMHQANSQFFRFSISTCVCDPLKTFLISNFCRPNTSIFHTCTARISKKNVNIRCAMIVWRG